MTTTFTVDPGPDGLTLQNAIQQLNAAGGGAVFVPSGTYRVENSLNITTPIELYGEGESSYVTFENVLSNCAISVEGVDGAKIHHLKLVSTNGPLRFAMLGLANSIKCEVRSCRIEGPSTRVSMGVQIQAGSEHLIEDNIFTGFGEADIYGSYSSCQTALRIARNRCISAANASMMLFNTSHSEISDNECANAICTAPDWAPDTPYEYPTVVKNDGGKYYECTTGGTSASSGGPTGEGDHILDGETVYWRYIEGCLQGGYGISCYRTSKPTTCGPDIGDLWTGHNEIRDNYIHDVEGSGIYLQSDPLSTVCGNRVERCASHQIGDGLPVGGIAINGAIEDVDLGCIVRGNQIHGCGGKPGITIHGPGHVVASNTIASCGTGIFLRGADSAVVTDNAISETGHAIYGTSRSFCIRGNKIADLNENGYGIDMANGVAGSITFNSLTHVSGDGITLSSASNIWVARNVIVDRAKSDPDHRYGIQLRQDCSHCDVIENHIENTVPDGFPYGIAITGGSAGNRVRGNVITGMVTASYEIDDTHNVTDDTVTLYEGPLVNVRDFGVVGDGEVDDREAIQAAIDTAGNGGIVYFPPGTYKITRHLWLKSNLILRGSGRQSVIKAGADYISLVCSDKQSGILIEDLAFVGNNTSFKDCPESGNGLYIRESIDVTVQRCSFQCFGDPKDTGGQALYFHALNKKISILDNLVSGGAGKSNSGDIEVYAGNTDVIIQRNRCWCDVGLDQDHRSSEGIAVNILGDESGRVIVSDNISVGHTRHGIIAAYGGGPVQRDTVIQNNICIDNDDTGIYLQAGDSNGWVIAGNIIGCCSGGPGNPAYPKERSLNGVGIDGGIALFGAGRKVVTGNFIYGTGYTSAGRVRNGFLDAPITGAMALRCGGGASGADDSIIANNIIDQSTGYGIGLEQWVGDTRSQIVNNKILDCTLSSILVNCTSFIKRLDIVGNHIEQHVQTEWIPLTHYPANAFVKNDSGRPYVGISDGRSAAAGNPTGTDMDITDGGAHSTCVGLGDAHGIDVIYTLQNASSLRICDNSIFGAKLRTGKVGIYFRNVSPFRGTVENNTVDNWDCGVMIASPASASCFGHEVTFNHNSIMNCATGIDYYLNLNQYAFGIDNTFVNNNADFEAQNYANWRDAMSLTPRKSFYDTGAPLHGAWVVGDLVYNLAPAAGGNLGWICTEAGTPGTWKEFGHISL